MIIVGAKGFAKQLVEVFFQTGYNGELYFFDSVSFASDQLYGYKLLRNFEEVTALFLQNRNFCLGIGGPKLRKKLAIDFVKVGGEMCKVISPLAHTAKFARIGDGACILTGAVVENDAIIGVGALVNTQASIHHDVVVDDFAEIAPGARLLGGCTVGAEAFIGANAIILPKIQIGQGAIVGAGAVVTRSVGAYTVVAGNPAKHIRDIQ